MVSFCFPSRVFFYVTYAFLILVVLFGLTSSRGSIFDEIFSRNYIYLKLSVVISVMAALAVANIVKSSLGPVGLDKMLVDDVGVGYWVQIVQKPLKCSVKCCKHVKDFLLW